MLLQCCTTLVSLRAFRPLLGAWSLALGAHPLSTDVDPEAGLAALLAAAEAESQQLAAAGATVGGNANRPWADSEVPADQQRLLQAGVMGVPNAGKSTLVNALVGTKVGRSSCSSSCSFIPWAFIVFEACSTRSFCFPASQQPGMGMKTYR